jgi:hypothetical protein
VSRVSAKARRAAKDLERWARATGFTYQAHSPDWQGFVSQLVEYPVQQLPVAAGAMDGRQLVVAQASGDVRAGQHEHLVVAMTVPLGLPAFTLRPRAPGTRADPYDVRTGIAAFDSTYRLQAPDPVAACGLLRPPLTDALLEIPSTVAGFGQWIATWRPGSLDSSTMALAAATIMWLGQEFGKVAGTRG